MNHMLRMRSTPVTLFFCVVLVVLGGCTSPQPLVETAVTAIPTEPVLVETAVTTEPVLEATALLTDILFMRVGGFAGFDDRLEVTKDGRIHYASADDQSMTRTITTAEIAELATLLQESGQFDKNNTFTAEGADFIVYTIQYNGVAVLADEDQVPELLRPVIDRLLLFLNE
jgi:hypothetical protein